MSWLHSGPLPWIGAVLFAALVLCAEAGYRGARWIADRRGTERTADPSSRSGGRDYLLTAMLGLMALLLGFTFSLALNRFEGRRDLVVREANALDTAWKHAQLLREPGRTAVSGRLRAYVEARLRWSESYAGRRQVELTGRLQKALWESVGAAVRAEPSVPIGRGLMEAVGESFDVATARLAARSANIPDRVLHILLLYIALAVVMLGEVSATRDGLHRASTWLLLLLLTLAILLILDLDRTSNGAIMVSQQALLDLRDTMR